LGEFLATIKIYATHTNCRPNGRITTETSTMRADIHPDYHEVLFHDTNADVYFLTRSTIRSKVTREYEGKEYPYVALDISSASHPFYTGEQRKTQNEGRVASFNKRFGAFAGRTKK
jgi:large subunit ribosomal protein L31